MGFNDTEVNMVTLALGCNMGCVGSGGNGSHIYECWYGQAAQRPGTVGPTKKACCRALKSAFQRPATTFFPASTGLSEPPEWLGAYVLMLHQR